MQYGHFDNQRREYVIDRVDVPVSWTNYLGLENLCTVISHNAGGYSFYKNAEHQRITRFRQNGVPLDRPGHYVYLRDDDTGEYWSISWQPVGKDLSKAKYECRHGLSYSKFSCDYHEILAEQTLFIPIGDDIELWDVKIKNTSSRPRRVSVFGYVEFSFHHIEIDNQNLQMSLYAAGSSFADGVIEYDFFYEPWTFHYFTSNFTPDSYDCLRDKFLGNYRTETNPISLEQGTCHGSSELGGNHCGALHKRLTLAPGEEARLLFLLGVGPRAKGSEVRSKYADLAKVDAAFDELRAYWQKKFEVFQCSTPHARPRHHGQHLDALPGRDLRGLVALRIVHRGGWPNGPGLPRYLAGCDERRPHQSGEEPRSALSNCSRVRSAADTVCTCSIRIGSIRRNRKRRRSSRRPSHTLPIAKQMIHGLEHTCSDDHLWLVTTVCEYVKETGELSLFDEIVPFADAGEATVYEHLKQALDFSAEQVGATGICKGLRADWNDCLNLGGGESAMVSFLHHWALRAFVEAATFLGRSDDAKNYSAMADKVRDACERELWDGDVVSARHHRQRAEGRQP